MVEKPPFCETIDEAIFEVICLKNQKMVEKPGHRLIHFLGCAADVGLAGGRHT